MDLEASMVLLALVDLMISSHLSSVVPDLAERLDLVVRQERAEVRRKAMTVSCA